jgi:acyl-coenzyme A synthetase/AMP-(fatty) acid ligase
MRQSDLRARLRDASPGRDAGLHGAGGVFMPWRVALSGPGVAGEEALAGKSVLVDVSSQFDAARAMLALDGLAARMLALPPGFGADRTASAMAQAAVDAVVGDNALGSDPASVRAAPRGQAEGARWRSCSTEWVLPTSGTMGAPKLVAHRLAGLLGAIGAGPGEGSAAVLGTFYDIRRYGGMQIFLRAVAAGHSLVVTDADESLASHVARMARLGVTHLSGTPSHWRRLLMSGEAARLSPRYVRLSGEIADRAILDALSLAYPRAKIVHAYASTEAGVGFEVTDGREGFPARYLDGLPGVDLRVVDGTLRVRSARTARGYVGREKESLFDAEGFVDTDDLVERIGERVYFRGRRGGAINVGGVKVHPEEVEEAINSHDAVRMSRARGRRSPITGDIVVAEVVLKQPALADAPALRDEILGTCRSRLGRHKAPASLRFVTELPLSPAGKILRERV